MGDVAAPRTRKRPNFQRSRSVIPWQRHHPYASVSPNATKVRILFETTKKKADKLSSASLGSIMKQRRSFARVNGNRTRAWDTMLCLIVVPIRHGHSFIRFITAVENVGRTNLPRLNGLIKCILKSSHGGR